MTVAPETSPRPAACLLDASIYIFRYYFSLPDNWFSEEGYPTAAVYGYTSFLLTFLAREQPVRMAACFDESLGSCFRNQLYPDYKSSRALPDDALAFQLRACREVTELLGITALASDTYEADDLLGTLMQQLLDAGEAGPIALLTRDKDLGQLLGRPQDFLWDYVNGRQQQRICRQAIRDKFGVWPEQLVDYLALVGDVADDIPGVPGVGAKTARTLLQWGQDMETVFARFEEIAGLPIRGARSLADKLLAHTRQIALSRSLAAIVRDVALPVGSRVLERRPPQTQAFGHFCQRMGFGPQLMHKLKHLDPEQVSV